MLTTFDIAQPNKALQIDDCNKARLLKYNICRHLYDGDFSLAFPNTITKIRKKYPLDDTTAQTLIELNLFSALTEFFKFLMTNAGIDINVDEKQQSKWDDIAADNNFLSVVKEVFVDNSRFGNGLFKVVLVDDKPQIFAICPDCWFPVFEKGNLNSVQGYILVYDLEIADETTKKPIQYKRIEKIYKGYTENELWQCNKSGILKCKTDLAILGVDEEENALIEENDDYTGKWNDFIVFPVKNSTESDKFFGTSDYDRCKSIVEDIMLTVSQNSKIINRHANPKMAVSDENLQQDPLTGKRTMPNTDTIKVGQDKFKPEYITVDLQAQAIRQHIDTLMQFFYIVTKTPPQAYGLDIAGNLSGESLRQIFMSALAKADDIKQVSFNSAIQKVVSCAMAFNKTPVTTVNINWGNPIPETYSEKVQNENSRVLAGTESKLSAIMTLDNVSEIDAKKEVDRISKEEQEKAPRPIDDLFPTDNTNNNDNNQKRGDETNV